MSDFTDILRKVRANLKQKSVRYLRIVATSDGAANGTTIVSTDLTELVDSWNAIEAYNVEHGSRQVEDFSTNTLTFTDDPWPKKIVTNDIFELYEPGTWRGDHLREHILNAGAIFIRTAPEDILRDFSTVVNGVGVKGVADIPAGIIRYGKPQVKIDNKKCYVVPRSKAAYLDEAAYLDNSDSYVGYFAGGKKFNFAPKDSVDVDFTVYIKPTFNTTDNWLLLNQTDEAVAFIATQLALQANELISLKKGWEQAALAFLN